MTAEIEYRAGRPWGFWATVGELEEAFAEVPDELIVEAYQEHWAKVGLGPPALSVEELRAKVLAIHRRAARLLPSHRKLTIVEAAPFLKLSERELRHRVDQGEFDSFLTTMRDGRRALTFEAPSKVWRLA